MASALSIAPCVQFLLTSAQTLDPERNESEGKHRNQGGIPMEQKRTRQGVKVKTVTEKRLCDSRSSDFTFFCFLLPLMILMNIPINGNQLSPGIFLVDCFLIAYMLWFLLWGRLNYMFLAKDGLYIVRHGWAVHIPWRKIKNVEIIYYLQGMHSSSGRILYIHYIPELTDEVTGTPVILHKKRDYSFPFTNKALKVFCKYTKII